MKQKIIITSLILIALFILPLTAYAEKGDLYDMYKSEFDRKLNPIYLDMVKDYSYEENTFDCGTFDITCKSEGLFLRMVIGTIKVMYGAIDSLVITPTSIVGNDMFNMYKSGLKTLSNTMLALFFMWQIAKIVAQRYADPDDGAVAINDKIVTVVVAGIFLGLYENIIHYILLFQQYAVQAILRETVTMEEVAKTVFINGGEYGILVALIIAICILVFSLAYMYRFVLFGLLYMVGVIAIPTAVNDEFNYFSIWIRQLVNNGVTLFLQCICFTAGFNGLMSNNNFSSGSGFTVAVAFFLLALAVPSLLGSLGASSGTGRSIGTVLRYASRMRR